MTAISTQKVWLPSSADSQLCCFCAIVWSRVIAIVDLRLSLSTAPSYLLDGAGDEAGHFFGRARGDLLVGDLAAAPHAR